MRRVNTCISFLEVVQPPTGVALVVTGKSTARVTWNSVSKVLLYQVMVSDNDNPDNAPVIRNTSATSMDISNLEPCSTYTVGVSSVNVFLMPGEAANVSHTTSSEYFSNRRDWYAVFCQYFMMYIHPMQEQVESIVLLFVIQDQEMHLGLSLTVMLLMWPQQNTTINTNNYFPSAINPVTTISVDYSCSAGMVTVTWDLVFGANLYRATAVDGTGASLNCTSDSSSCQITMLKCGEKYQVHVTAISDDCESTSNISSLFETGEWSTCSCGNNKRGFAMACLTFHCLYCLCLITCLYTFPTCMYIHFLIA